LPSSAVVSSATAPPAATRRARAVGHIGGTQQRAPTDTGRNSPARPRLLRNYVGAKYPARVLPELVFARRGLGVRFPSSPPRIIPAHWLPCPRSSPSASPGWSSRVGEKSAEAPEWEVWDPSGGVRRPWLLSRYSNRDSHRAAGLSPDELAHVRPLPVGGGGRQAWGRLAA